MSVEVRSLNNYLFVIEGEDIWMVYNGSSSCLNVELWDLRFSFPTIISALRAVESGTYMADWGIREIFLNFMLGE